MRNNFKFLVKTLACITFFTMLFSLSLNAQTFKAALKGHVLDEEGKSLPGVTVTVNSPAEITKDLSSIANEKGYYHFSSLTPGEYEIKAELQGFTTVIRSGVKLQVGEVAVINFVLPMTALEEYVTVIADAMLVETTKASVGETIHAEYIDSLPTLDRSYMNLATLVPGTAIDPRSGRISASGERMRSANVIIDGIDNNDNVASFGQILVDQYTLESIKEYEIMAAGYNAEYGEASGAVINIVTKSGSNTFSGSLFFYHRNDALDASPLEGQEPALLKRYEYGFTLGGPIIRDKLWFFVATQFINQKEGIEYDFSIVPEELHYDFYGRPENFEAVPQTSDQSYYLKLSFGLNRHNRINTSVMYFPNKLTNWRGHRRAGGGPIGGKYLPSAGHTLKTPGLQFKFNLSSFLSQSLILESNIGYLFRKDIAEPNVTETPWEIFPNFFSGRYDEDPREFRSKKFQWSEDLTLYVDNWGGNHTFKTGLRFISDNQSGYMMLHNMVWYATDSRAFPVFTISFVPVGRGFNYDVTLRSYGTYIQDAWEIVSNLVLHLGLRFDRMSPFNHNQWSPRFGFSWDPFKDNKTAIRAHIGRFYDQNSGNALLLDMNWGGIGRRAVFYPGLAPFLGGPPQPGIDLPYNVISVLHTPFRTPYTDAWGVGIEREVVRDLSLSVHYLHRDGKDIYSRRVINWREDNQGTTDGGPRIQETGYENYSHYRAFHIALEKRFSHGFQFLTSYTYSKWRDVLNDNFISIPDDHNNIHADYGPAEFDIPHKFVFSGFGQLPYGFTIAAIITAQSGLPYSAARIFDKDNDGLFERPDDPIASKRNVYRRPPVASVDVRLGKTFLNGHILVFLEAFNLLNRKNVDQVFINWYDKETFGSPQTYGYGRILQLAVRITY